MTTTMNLSLLEDTVIRVGGTTHTMGIGGLIAPKDLFNHHAKNWSTMYFLYMLSSQVNFSVKFIEYKSVGSFNQSGSGYKDALVRNDIEMCAYPVTSSAFRQEITELTAPFSY